MSWLDRVSEFAEDRLGVAVRPAARAEELEVREREFGELASEVEELTSRLSEFFHARPNDPEPEKRRRLVFLSRIALRRDPLAAAEAGLLADFSLARGVPTPTSEDPKVQEVIDRAWSDPMNKQKLTGYLAQRKLSNDLMTAGEVFLTAYVAGGRIVVGSLLPEEVVDIVSDPDDKARPMWYVVKQSKMEWDFDNDRPKVELSNLDANGREKVRYYEHWQNVDLAERERDMEGVGEDSTPLPTVPTAKLARGKVFHLALNTVGAELRGTPPWARSLRFFDAMTKLTEAHVQMAQASQQIIAKRVMQGSPRAIQKAVAAVESQVSELGMARGARLDGMGKPQGGGMVPPPGSWFNENQASKLESIKLDSGAAQMVQTAQLVRAPLAAGSGFGQHYLGDASTTNLASASTLELPSTMRVQSWQRYPEEVLRWFTDMAIEAAVQEGELGGSQGYPDERRELGELRIWEAEDRDTMERRTKKKLDYDFTMPFPGRRQLEEVSAWAQTICATMDPNGVNIPLRRYVLRLALEPLALNDLGRVIEECLPEDGSGGIGPPKVDATGQPIPAGMSPEDVAKMEKGRAEQIALAAGGAQGAPAGGGGDAPKNVKRTSTPPGEKRASEAELTEAEQGLLDEVFEAFRSGLRVA